MTRAKRGSVAKKKRNKVTSHTKGFVGAHSKLFRTAKQQMMKGLRYAFSDRRKKKNQYRRLWITRLNAMVKKINSKYNKYIGFLKNKCININRKMFNGIGLCDIQAPCL